MKKKQKIIFIIWSFTYGGGAETLLANIVNCLDAEKYDISIIELIHAEYKIESVNENIHILPYITSEHAPDRRKKMFDVIHRPWVIFDKYIGDEYDLYIAFNYQKPSFLLQPNKKNIVWIHGDIYDLLSCKMLEERIWQEEVFFKCNRIVAISDRTELSIKTLFERHSNRITKIYNGIDIEKVRKKSESVCNLAIKKNSICFVGRLDENKNPKRALHIFKLLHDFIPSTHIYYLGEGDMMDELSELSEKLDLKDNVHFLGYCDNPFPIIKQCRALIHTSYSEGFQMSILEGLSLGVPFVSTDVGASRMMSNGGTCGTIFETNEEAVKGLIRIINYENDGLEKIKDLCEKSVVRFDISKYIKQIEELIDTVIYE